jgi:hypothetical protein
MLKGNDSYTVYEQLRIPIDGKKSTVADVVVISDGKVYIGDFKSGNATSTVRQKELSALVKDNPVKAREQLQKALSKKGVQLPDNPEIITWTIRQNPKSRIKMAEKVATKSSKWFKLAKLAGKKTLKYGKFVSKKLPLVSQAFVIYQVLSGECGMNKKQLEK